MRMYMATRVAAVAIGLSLASGMALAAPDDRRGSKENVGASEEKDGDQDKRRTRRNAKPADNQAPAANQTRRGTRDFGARNARGRNNPIIDRARDNRRNFGDRNDRRDWRDRNRRKHVNIQQYRRNFNAPRRYNVGMYQWRDGYSYRRYGYGQRLPRHFFLRNFWLANFFAYGLFAPPPGYIWVRYGPDALLIDEYTGEIVQVRYNMFY